MRAHQWRRLVLLVVLLATVGAGQSTAYAKGMTTGFFSDPVLTRDDAAMRAKWLPRMVSEGGRMIRITVDWSSVAPSTRPPGFSPADPSSPGYNWTSTDAAVQDAASHGLKILVTIVFAPRWAEARGKPAGAPAGTWRPDPAQFAAFATAAARRYDGSFGGLPRVSRWQAWNEPNLDYYLTPQWTRGRHGLTPASPALYVQLLNAFYSAVKSVSPSNFVLMAGTAPYGDAPGSDPVGQERMPPVQFDRHLFCLKDDKRLTPYACPDKPQLDAIDHHPYSVSGPLWHAQNPDDVAIPDLGKLTRVLQAAQRDGHVLPKGPPKPLWITEISWDSNPPDPNGVPVQTQARWLELAYYVMWSEGVATALWAQIVDLPCVPNCGSTSQSGVYFRNGKPKPSAQAFRFPFVTVRQSSHQVLAWGRAPAPGQLAIEALRQGRWVTIREVSVGYRELFHFRMPLSGRTLLRAQVGGQTSLVWTQNG